MILTPEETIRRNLAEGAWSGLTVDQVFRRAVSADPRAVAFRDLGPSPVPGTGGVLTFAEADRRIDGLASFFASLGLKPDMAIGIHLPPSADATVIVLAAMRAGLIVCPVPLHCNRSEITAIVAAANLRALVTATQLEGLATGEAIRDVAAEAFSVRFVFAIGTGVPDGLIDLGEILSAIDQFGAPPEVFRRGRPSAHVALLSLARDVDDRVVVVPFSHDHLVAAALAHVVVAGMHAPAAVLATMHPASLAGFAGTVLTALLAGGEVGFHHVRRLDELVAAAEAFRAARIVLPVPLGDMVATRLWDGVALSLVTSALAPERAGARAGGHGTVHLLTLGGLCLLPVALDPGRNRPSLPSGPVRLPVGGVDGPVLFEARVKPRRADPRHAGASGRGELILSGPLVPDAPWPEPASGGSGAGLVLAADGALRTGLCVEAGPMGIDFVPPEPDRLVVSGRSVSARRVEALLRTHAAVADAAVFALPDPLTGCRLGVAIVPTAGESITPEDLQSFMDANGAGALDSPASLAIVAEIPRAADGSAVRDALFLDRVA
jgi:non-ribosomal peptide synthetase component E (peptide arylation enzyme)